MSLSVEEYDLSIASDEDLAPILAAINLLDKETHPRHVDMTLGELRIFADNPGMVQRRFRVVDTQGGLVGMATCRHPDDGTNLKTLLCSIRVLPEHRRKGVATILLGHLADIASELGRDTMQGFFFDTVPAGREFALRVGAVEKMDFHENVLRIDAIDRSLLQSWVDLGPQRAPGYSVRLIEDRWPEELFEDLAHLYFVLERDMPLSDSFEPQEWTAQRVGELQDHYADGVDALSTFAFHDESGKAIGMSDMIRRKTDPTTWIVTTTMVDPDHRGKSIGKWVKGAVNLAALDRWEGGVYQETGNAFLNEPMLAINRAMGFEHELTMTDCSVDAADAQEFVRSRL